MEQARRRQLSRATIGFSPEVKEAVFPLRSSSKRDFNEEQAHVTCVVASKSTSDLSILIFILVINTQIQGKE